MIDSAEAGNLDDVEKALADEASITTTDGFGWTALHYAAFSGSEGVVKVSINQMVVLNPGNNPTSEAELFCAPPLLKN